MGALWGHHGVPWRHYCMVVRPHQGGVMVPPWCLHSVRMLPSRWIQRVMVFGWRVQGVTEVSPWCVHGCIVVASWRLY